MPEQDCAKRRRQILTDETGDDPRFDPRARENALIPDDAWVKNFVGRLTDMVRSIGGKH